MAGFSKVFKSILTSTIWCEDHATVRVWLAMLVSADADGVVEGSVPGFASLARVKVEEMLEALRIFQQPDPDSRTKEHEGRRVEEIPGGWLILNHTAYREKVQAREGSRAPYQRAWRAKKREGR